MSWHQLVSRKAAYLNDLYADDPNKYDVENEHWYSTLVFKLIPIYFAGL